MFSASTPNRSWRSPAPRLFAAFALAAGLPSQACLVATEANPGSVIVCATDADCPGDFECVEPGLVCVSPELVDLNGPDHILPAAGEVVRDTDILFVWSGVLGARSYVLELSEDPEFGTLVGDTPTTVREPDNSTIIAGPLNPATHYWRVWADVTDNPEPAASVVEVIDDVVRVYCDPSESCSVSSRPEAGNVTHPFRSIPRALELADRLNLTEVRVARRGDSLAYGESFVLRAGVNVAGGFDPSFELANQDLTRPTKISVVDEPAIVASGISLPTLLEGFEVEADGAEALWAGQSSGLVVSDCELGVVDGGGMPAVHIAGGGPSLLDNSIWSYRAYGSIATAIRIDGFGGRPSLSGNVIRVLADPGEGISFVRAVVVGEFVFVYLTGNVIIADSGYTESIAVDAGESSYVVANNNFIYATTVDGSDGRCVGIELRDAGLEAYNNVIVTDAGGEHSMGTAIIGAEHYNRKLVNNTIVAAGGTVLTTAVFIEDSDPTLINNILCTAGGSGRHAIHATGWDLGASHNLLFAAPGGLFWDGDTGTVIAIDDVPDYDNFTTALALEAVFVDLDGPDNQLGTWEDNDLHLLLNTDPDGIATGGTEGSGVPSEDIEGTERDSPYSVGAYEGS